MKKIIHSLSIIILIGNFTSINALYRALQQRSATSSRSITKPSPRVVSSSIARTRAISLSPFIYGQRRAFSVTTPAQQKKKASWGEWFSSLLSQKELTAEEFAEKFDKITFHHTVKQWQAPNGRFYNDWYRFDESDLEKAKKLVDDNKQFINTVMQDQVGYDERSQAWVVWARRSGSTYGIEDSQKTMLDMILGRIFRGDSNFTENFVVSENQLNLLKLASYILDQGGTVHESNKSAYKKAYLKLMIRYRALYSDRASTNYGVEYELETLKKVFRGLDVILEKVVPEMQQEIREAQQVRADMEKNEASYRAKATDKADRVEFLRKRIQRFETRWRVETGKWDYGDSYSGWKNANWDDPQKDVHWDEDEYQAWLRGESPGGGFRFESGEFGIQSAEQSITHWLPEVTNKTPYAEAKKAFNVYSKINHPDKLSKELSAEEKTKKEEDYKKFINAWDNYNASRQKTVTE